MSKLNLEELMRAQPLLFRLSGFLRPSHRRGLLWVLLTSALFFRAAPARAQVHLSLEGVVDAPLDVGAALMLEVPGRIRFSVAGGVMPGFFADGYTGMAKLFNEYSGDTSTLVRNAITSSLVGRFHLGWRPMPARGFYFALGYSFAAFGGSNSAAALIAKVSGQMPPPDDPSMPGYMTNSVLHMADLELGWEWALFWRFTARIAVGASWTFASTSSITPAFPTTHPDQQTMISQSVMGTLNSSYKNTVTPMVTFAIGLKIL